MKLPKVLYRGSDGDKLILNEDDNTYSAEKSMMATPYKYSYDVLIKSGFLESWPPPAPEPEKFMWEILVPTERKWDDGKVRPIRTRYHRVWDDKVRAITGGLTILQPARGQWVSPSNELFAERMIPVRIYCTKEEIEKIIDLTMEYYNQEAVLAYKVSCDVMLKYRKK